MLAGVVHKGKDGTLWFDDVPVREPKDLPRRPAWAGTLWYATSDVLPSDLGRLCQPEDTAFGPAPGSILGVRFRVGKKRRMRVLAASSWGVERRDPDTVLRSVQRLYADAISAGLEPRQSAAGTALRAYLDRFDGEGGAPSLAQLPCRFRALAHAAMHGGPVQVLRGGAEHATLIDVRRAYLSALYQDFPVYGRNESGSKVGGWYGVPDGTRWSDLRNRVGIVDAIVRVRPDPSGLPALPVHLSVGSVHATGRLRGVWTIEQVRTAEARGEAEVEAVCQGMFAPQTAPLFAELADFFASLPPELGKRLYTRFWGRLGYRGGYVGVASEAPVQGAVPGVNLWWTYEGVGISDPAAPPTYRPDLSAFVAARNHARVIETTRRLAAGSVVAVHVDAIWTTDTAGAKALHTDADTSPGTWRVQREGRLRFYGPGCYAHEGHLGASGYHEQSRGPLTEESLAMFVSESTSRRLTLSTRRWTADPAEDANASSRPVELEMDPLHQPTEGPPVGASCWTPGGWMRKADEADDVLSEVA